jgi:WD40 repeat protein
MTLRDNLAGTLLIAVLVAVGFWFANRPDALQQGPLQKFSRNESKEVNSGVYVRKISWSSDSRKLLTLSRGEVGLDGPLALHDLDDRPHRLTLDVVGERVATAALVPGGRHVLVATHEGRLRWIGLQSDENKLLLELPGPAGFSWAAVSADGRHVAAATSDGSIYRCDPAGVSGPKAAKVLLAGPASRITNLRFSNDGTLLLCAAWDGSISVWDLNSGKLRRTWTGHEQPAMAVAMLPDERIISASLDDTVRIWEFAVDRETWRVESGLFGVTALAVSEDGKSAAWGGHRRKVVVWDVENARKKYEIQVSASIVMDIQFSPDNKLLAVAGKEGMLRLYDAKTGTEQEGLEMG